MNTAVTSHQLKLINQFLEDKSLVPSADSILDVNIFYMME